MLSCKFSGPGSLPYNQRLASADRIVEIIARGGYETLPPLPLIPYAMSMSTTTIYRAFRDGQRDTETAYRNLCICCEALEALSQLWTSTKGVTKLAKQLENRLYRDLVMSKNLGDPVLRSAIPPTSRTTTLTDGLTDKYHRNGTRPDMKDTVTDMPVHVQPGQDLNVGGPPDSTESFLCAPSESSLCANECYNQLDEAFYGLFDHGAPDIFLDPAAWEFLRNTDNEDSSAESELRLPYL